MNYGNAGREYLRNRVMTASPIQIVVMLYDGAISSMVNAREALSNGDRIQARVFVGKAQGILGELVSSLDRVSGAEIAAQLDALYAFVQNRLTRGNIDQDGRAFSEAEKVMRTLREGWAIIAANSAS